MDPASTAAVVKGAGTAAAMLGGKRSKWLAHVKKTMKAHKGKSLKAVLKMAKKTYNKGGAYYMGGSALSPHSVSHETGPIAGGRRKTRRGARRH
jgi:hypothetical protein